MDPISAIGLAGNIVQFVDFGGQVIERLLAFYSATDNVPKTFREIKTRLPLLINSLKRIQQDLNDGKLDQQTEDALLPVVRDCTEHVKALYQILEETLPAPDDSQWKTVTKALKSFRQEQRIQEIRSSINAYQGDLLLHQVTNPSRTSDGALEHQRSLATQTSGRSGSIHSSRSGTEPLVLSMSRTHEQFTSQSPKLRPSSITSSLGSPTEKLFDSPWSARTWSTAWTDSSLPTPVASKPKAHERGPTSVEGPSEDPPLLLPGPAIDRPERAIEAKMTYTPEGGLKYCVASRLEFGRTNNGTGNVTSVLWADISNGLGKCHSLLESSSKYPHTEHPAADSQPAHIVSFLGRQVLLEQKQSAEQTDGAPEPSLLPYKRPPNSDLIFTETIDYSFNSAEDLKLFRQIIFGKTLVTCIPVNKISLTKTECETEALSLWESCGVRTVVYFASARSREHIELEVASSDALRDYTKSPPGLTLNVKAKHMNQRASSISSNGSAWSISSKSKGKDYVGLKIKFGSVEDRDRFAHKVQHWQPSSS